MVDIHEMAGEGLPGPSRRNLSSPSFSNSLSSDSSQSRGGSRSPFYTRSRRRRWGSYSRRSRRRSPHNDSSEDENYKRKRSRSNSVEKDGNRRSGDWDMNHNAHKLSRKEDRISQLPDSVILHILSFLPTQDSVKTGILSKRWAYLWTSVPCLSFSRGPTVNCYPKFSVNSFIHFVNATLLLHSCSNVEKFAVSFFPEAYYNSACVDRWIRLMTQAKVKELTLDFIEESADWDDYEDEDGYYTLPQHLYRNSSLTKLELSMCVVRPVGGISWDRLKSLSLGWVRLDDVIMRDVIEGCPVIEFLELYRFYGISRLNFTNRCLRKLVIRDHRDYPDQIISNSTLEISAPYLQSLTMSGEIWSGKYRVLNATYLVDCYLNFASQFHNNNTLQPDMLRDLLDDLRHAQAVTLGESFIQVLSLMEVKGVSFSPSECKCLKLDACLEERDLPGIASLLKSSPGLENLIINLTNSSDQEFMFGCDKTTSTGENYWKSQTNFECLLLHLKTIKITGIVPRNSWKLVLQLIEFLVKNARVLEKMTVYTEGAYKKYFHKGYVSKEVFEAAQKLLSFPKSSPHAVVTFLE